MHPLFSSYTGLQCGRSTRTSPSPSSSPSSSRCSSSSTTGLCTTSWPAPLLSSAEEPDSDCQPVAGGPRLADKWDSNCTLTVDAFRFRPRTLVNPVGAGFYFIFLTVFKLRKKSLDATVRSIVNSNLCKKYIRCFSLYFCCCHYLFLCFISIATCELFVRRLEGQLDRPLHTFPSFFWFGGFVASCILHLFISWFWGT